MGRDHPHRSQVRGGVVMSHFSFGTRFGTTRERDDEICRMRATLSIDELADAFGLSKAAVHQVLHRRGVKSRPPALWKDPMRAVEFDTNGGCWLWTASGDKASGRGQMFDGGRLVPAALFFFQWKTGIDPTGKEVCHKCDVPACVNPDHLFLGSHAENMADWRLKGLSKKAASKTYKNGRRSASKLDASAAIQIVKAAKSGESYRAIARRFGVANCHVSQIVNGKKWARFTEVDR
jgi:transcriptional regulator with XRE-family HTH domain